MKNILFRFVCCIVFIGIIGCLFIGGIGFIEIYHNRYEDSIKFDTLDEAYDFQKVIMNEADEQGYKVIESNISVCSPPEYSFSIQTDGNSFKYGNENLPDWIIYSLQGFISLICLATLIAGIGGIILIKDDKE